jgi:hypothetical protein
MIPAGDHHTRSLLLRRVSSWSQASLGGGEEEEVEDEQNEQVDPVVDANDRTHDTTNTNTDPRHHSRQVSLHSLNLMRSLLELEQAPSAALECSSLEHDYDDEDGTGPARSLQEPLLPRDEQQQHQRHRWSYRLLPPRPKCNDIKLYIVFVLLVAAGVSNVILVKLQSVPMYVNENGRSRKHVLGSWRPWSLFF